jgi:gliding-associated putative ABC transporter substrate-binding component GldG
MKQKNKANYSFVTVILLLLGVLILVNLISVNMFTRLDLTEGKIYTLAPASKEAVANLPDRLTVRAYFTENLPAPYSSNARYLKDQLEDYRAHSGGKFHFEFVDPATESELEAEAQRYQIPPVQVQVVEKDKVEVKKVYMGLVFLYGDKQETIPLVQNTSGLEYDITATIKKITADRIPHIGFLTGQGEVNATEEMTRLVNELEKNYKVETVDVTSGDMISNEIDALMIIHPTETFSDWTLFCIDQFIMKGGKVGFLVNKVNANLQEGRATKYGLNLDDFTKHLGFRISDDLVYDKVSGMINVQEQRGFFQFTSAMPYPFFPVIRDFNKDINMVRDLEDLALFFPSSIDTSVLFDTTNVSVEVFARTSDKSNRQMGRFEINPMTPQFKRISYPMAGIPVGATLIGSFSSYFSGKEIPTPSEGESSFDGNLIEQSPETRIVAIGEGNFVQDTYMQSLSNRDFFMNMVDWLAQDESLIHIRTREITTRPLNEISESAKAMTKYLNIFLPCIIIILIGVVRWQIRRKYKPVL